MTFYHPRNLMIKMGKIHQCIFPIGFHFIK
uniref:Uncharacterized protein n=1 Tax=Anguilla anguilla TaxID=7936 RepID=A0A0E9SXP8_ANGAN